jgi:hypothetical protein
MGLFAGEIDFDTPGAEIFTINREKWETVSPLEEERKWRFVWFRL